MIKWKLRFQACWRIITGKYKHWVLVNVSEADFIEMIVPEDTNLKKPFDMNLVFCGAHEYFGFKILKLAAGSNDYLDMALLKAKFEAQLEEANNEKERAI